MLKRDPKERLKATDLLHHTIFKHMKELHEEAKSILMSSKVLLIPSSTKTQI
jgi:hypothetical protein